MHPQITSEYLVSQGFSQSFERRFLAKVQKTESCWLWIGGKDSAGYGSITQRTGVRIRGHVASWILHNGPIPPGLWVLHNCPGGDNRACVNPAHLWLGTHAENMADMVAKGKSRKGPRGSLRKLTWDQVAEIRASEAGTCALARAYGVGANTIYRVITHKTWLA